MSEERTGVEVVRSTLIKLINHNYCTFQDCIEAVEIMKKVTVNENTIGKKSMGKEA